MRLNARRLLGLIALAILVAVVALLLFRPQVAAPTAETASNPAAPIANAIPEVDPMPWAAVDRQAQEEPFAADQPQGNRTDGLVDGGDLILGWRVPAAPRRRLR